MILSFREYDEYSNFFINNNLFLRHHKLFIKPDVTLKWGYVMTNLRQLIKPNDTILDLGAGDLAIAVSSLQEFGNLNIKYYTHDIKRYSVSNFLKIPAIFKQGFYREILLSLKILYQFYKYKPKHARSSHIKFLRSIPSNSVDIIIDACSMIHFNSTPIESEGINQGIKETVEEAKRILKKGGHFLVVCDVQVPDEKNSQIFSTEVLDYQKLTTFLEKYFRINLNKKESINKMNFYERINTGQVLRYNVLGLCLVNDG